MAAADILDFQNIGILGFGGSKGSKCVTVQNFAAVGHTVAWSAVE